MPRFNVSIVMENEIFEDNPATELGRILREIAKRVEAGHLPPWPVMDVNGNRVGTVQDDD